MAAMSNSFFKPLPEDICIVSWVKMDFPVLSFLIETSTPCSLYKKEYDASAEEIFINCPLLLYV